MLRKTPIWVAHLQNERVDLNTLRHVTRRWFIPADGYITRRCAGASLHPFPHPPSSPTDMEQTASSQPFVSLFDPLPSSRTSAASIWAPQPQPSDTAWTKAIDSFSRTTFGGAPMPLGMRPSAHRSSSYPAPQNNEDVFGPVGFDVQRRRDVGAIGDGRKKLSPTYDERVSLLYADCMRIR